MRKISLQWRLTILTTVLITVLCGCLTFFLYKNGVYYIDTLQETVTDQGTAPEAVYIDIPDNEWDDFAAQFATKVYNSKSDYRNRSLLITAVVALLGGAVTYFVSGRALKPLREFSETVEKVQAQNLADYTIEENKIAELDRLRTSYNKMLMRLSESFETQRQFTGNAAHELRTPLALIQAQLDLYHTTEHPESGAAAEETIQMVTEQNERLSRLVRTLLDMSELQTVARGDKIELQGLIEEVLTDLEPLAQEKNIELIQKDQSSSDGRSDGTEESLLVASVNSNEKPEDELILTGSDILIYRMIYNLVENAIKYNQINGTVTVSAKREKNEVVLTVADTGNGIDESFREQIFEPFFRVDKSRSRELGGVGLGLAMVREIVRAHDGKIEVRGNEQGGTTFEVRIGITE
nr:HAMP domain-containing sensor histidine kinase [uncultured Mediterraneibacter sp.]